MIMSDERNGDLSAVPFGSSGYPHCAQLAYDPNPQLRTYSWHGANSGTFK